MREGEAFVQSDVEDSSQPDDRVYFDAPVGFVAVGGVDLEATGAGVAPAAR